MNYKFRIWDGAKFLYSYAENGESFYYGDKYDEEVSRETYSVESMTWNWLKFKISVKKVGKYVVDIYNDKDVFINSGYFEVIK